MILKRVISKKWTNAKPLSPSVSLINLGKTTYLKEKTTTPAFTWSLSTRFGRVVFEKSQIGSNNR